MYHGSKQHLFVVLCELEKWKPNIDVVLNISDKYFYLIRRRLSNSTTGKKTSKHYKFMHRSTRHAKFIQAVSDLAGSRRCKRETVLRQR